MDLKRFHSYLLAFACLPIVWCYNASHGQLNEPAQVRDLNRRSYGYQNTNGFSGASMASAGLVNQGLFFSNFDTALTTLAVLSFGVFLLNMIFSFLDMGNTGGGTGGVVLGRQKVQKPGKAEITKPKSRRSIYSMLEMLNDVYSQPQAISSCQLGPHCNHFSHKFK